MQRRGLRGGGVSEVVEQVVYIGNTWILFTFDINTKGEKLILNIIYIYIT